MKKEWRKWMKKAILMILFDGFVWICCQFTNQFLFEFIDIWFDSSFWRIFSCDWWKLDNLFWNFIGNLYLSFLIHFNFEFIQRFYWSFSNESVYWVISKIDNHFNLVRFLGNLNCLKCLLMFVWKIELWCFILFKHFNEESLK